jgi:hypothetical protein
MAMSPAPTPGSGETSGLARSARAAAAAIVGAARFVRLDPGRLSDIAAALGDPDPYPPPAIELATDDLEARASFHLTVDALNFGSGWFPTLRKREGRSGFFTIALGLRDHGPWDAAGLQAVTAGEIAAATGQDPGHPLMALYAVHARELGRRAAAAGGFLPLARTPGLAQELATWPTFADAPFYKRAQLTAYDMVCAGFIVPGGEGDLTMFADNLVPHVLRVDGALVYDDALAARIDAGELLEHGSPEEVEIRAAGLHAVEELVALRPELTAPAIDHLLWHRGQAPEYKAVPRHRARCTAY